MEKATLAQFLETKGELLAIAQTMTADARRAGRAEIMEAATLYDIPDDMTNPRELYRVSPDGTAAIPVRGKLTQSVDVCDGFFSDVTTYGFISAAALAADADPSVTKIAFNFSTGGGTVSGVDKCARVLAGLKKPTEARVSGMCASAGYWLASQLDRIVATSPTDFLGSIGVAMELVDMRDADAARGVKRYVLASTDAPDKRLDIATKEGQDKYVEELDALHGVFAARVASGRGVTVETVNKEFGRGGVLIAARALSAGMVDAVEDMPVTMPLGNAPDANAPPAKAGTTKEEAQQMTLSELLAANPAAKADYTANLAAARAEGETAGIVAMTAKIEKVTPFLISKDYGDAVKKTAVAVLKGEQTTANFDAVVSAVDAVREENALAAATKETDATKETPGQQHKTREPGAIVSTDADLMAEIARMQKGA
jgi:ClpP class serine protease